MKNNEIYMIRGTQYQEMTEALLEAANLAERIPESGSRIGIKPNFVSPSDPSMGAVTHPEVVAGIIEYLRRHGFENLVVLEGSWVGSRTREVIRAAGYDRLFEKYGVEFFDTQKDSATKYDCRGMKLEICDCVKSLDFLINVPVMKGHCQTRITCALKNMKGLIPNREKRRFHSMGLHKPIAHFNTQIRQDFIVVDSICGDWDFEDGGHPRTLNRILAAADPVLCDAYVRDLMGYGEEDVPYIRMAEELGVGCGDLGRLRVICCGGDQDRILMPDRRRIVEVQDAVEEVESCSACYGYLIPVLDQLREERLLQKLDCKICIGQGYRGRTGELGIGSCTGKFRHSLKGCPPMPDEMYRFLKEYIEK